MEFYSFDSNWQATTHNHIWTRYSVHYELANCLHYGASKQHGMFVQKQGHFAYIRFIAIFYAEIPARSTIMVLPAEVRPAFELKFLGVNIVNGAYANVMFTIQEDGVVYCDSTLAIDYVFMTQCYITAA